MNYKRILSTLWQLKRFPELLRCYRDFTHPTRIALNFSTLAKGTYPTQLRYKKKYQLEITCWEDLTTAWVVLLGKEYRIFASDRTILDFGGNIGMFAIYANSLNQQARIISVEPFPKSYALLRETISQNHLEKNVECRQAALSGTSGKVRFDASPEVPSHSRRILHGTELQNQIVVTSHTLGTFLDAEGLDNVDFIKIDIEGSEYDLICTASPETLRRAKRYGIEYHSRGIESIQDCFLKAGFSVTYHPKNGQSGVIEFTRNN